MVVPSFVFGGDQPGFAAGWRSRAMKINAYSAATLGRQSPMEDFASPK